MRTCFSAVILPVLSVVLFSCGEDTAVIQQNNAANIHYAPGSNAQNYMHTGFYHMGAEGSGVKMKQEGTGKTYLLAPNPFASVYNIRKTEIVRSPSENGTYTELCLTFDSKGRTDLEEGTGNPQHPYIAVVIAGKLLYVVQNRDKIKTGVMCIGVDDYPEKEIEAMKQAIDHKQ